MKVLKRALAFVLAIATVLACMSLPGVKENVFADTFGDWTYYVNASGTVEITGYNNSQTTNLTIPDKINGKNVTCIRDNAFYERTGLKSVSIPDGVTSIGSHAFYGCSGLTSISIPDSVTSIGTYAFSGCSELTSISIPDGVTCIERYLFSGCSKLASVNFSSDVEIIWDFAFSGCSSLTSIIIPDEVQTIEESMFSGCSSLTNIIIPYGVCIIEKNAFSGCSSLLSIVIPSSVADIESNIVYGCENVILYVAEEAQISQVKSWTGLTGNRVQLLSEHSHTGGDASCTQKGICSICGNEYGGSGHDFETEWTVNGNNHWHKCKNCDAIGSEATHSGGTATCTQKAVCAVCGEAYGDLSSHDFSTEWTSDGTNHWHKCKNCDAIQDKTSHTGGEATCTQKAVCTVCGEAYGDLGGHDFESDWETDNIYHWHKCKHCEEISEKTAHSYTAIIVPATVSADGKVEIACSCGMTILPCVIKKPSTITLSQSTYVYSGSQCKPTVTVKDSAGDVIPASEYKVTYGTNKSIGKGTVKITFTSVKYSGSITKEFEIVPTATNVKAISNASSGITITWDKNTTATGYVIYRSVDGSSYAKLATITANTTVSYTDTKVDNGKKYSYKVYPYKTVSSANFYNKQGAAKTIYRLTATMSSVSNASNGLTVKWSKNAAATGYYVYRSVNGGSYSKIKAITSNSTVSYTDTGASTNGAKYTYKIVAYKTVSGTTYTSTYSDTKTYYRLTTPTISSATNSSAKTITVKWSKNSKATGYEIKYVTGSTTKTVTVTSYSTVSKAIGSLTKGSTYKVYVRAYKTVSGTKYYSAWSAATSVKVTK